MVQFVLRPSFIHVFSICYGADQNMLLASSGRGNLRLTLFLGNCAFHGLDLIRSKAGERTLVLGSGEAGADGTFEI